MIEIVIGFTIGTIIMLLIGIACNNKRLNDMKYDGLYTDRVLRRLPCFLCGKPKPFHDSDCPNRKKKRN